MTKRDALGPTHGAKSVADAGQDLMRSGLAVLAVGSAIEAVARLMIVPWYDEPDRYIEEILDGRGTHLVGAVGSLVAATVIAVGLMRMWAGASSYGKAVRSFLSAALLLPIGLGGVAALAFAAGSFGQDTEPAVAISVWREVWDSGGADVGWYAAILGSIAASVGLVGLAHRRVLPRVPTALICLGALATAVTSEGPVTGVLVACALVLSVGAGWAAAVMDRPNGEATGG